MKTSTCISSAPVMPAVWPQSETYQTGQKTSAEYS